MLNFTKQLLLKKYAFTCRQQEEVATNVRDLVLIESIKRYRRSVNVNLFRRPRKKKTGPTEIKLRQSRRLENINRISRSSAWRFTVRANFDLNVRFLP